MIEVEIKAKAGHDAVKNRLKQEGASLEKTVEQADVYFNAPDRDFAVTDEALRLRDEGGQVFLTYKGRKLDPLSKTRREVDVEVADFKGMEELIRCLGYRETLRVHKTRDTYQLDGALVCLDRVDGLGEFVELETLAIDGDDVPARRDILIKTMGRLGISGGLIRESYLEMLLAKRESA